MDVTSGWTHQLGLVVILVNVIMVTMDPLVLLVTVMDKHVTPASTELEPVSVVLITMAQLVQT